MKNLLITGGGGYVGTNLTKELLNEGAKSLSQSWILQALHYDWKRKKGYKEPPEIDCSSSYKEWEESIKKHSI